jgi:hypothetical protein
MEESAAQRTPIEIWTIILQYTLATPSFPFTNDSYSHLETNILKNIHLFPFDCDLYREFLSMKKASQALRLVCRTWASILTSIPYRCVFANSDGLSCLISETENRIVERVQIIDEDDDAHLGTCSRLFSGYYRPCLLSDRPHAAFEHQKDWMQRFDDGILRELFRHVRILRLDNRKLDAKKLISFI